MTLLENVFAIVVMLVLFVILSLGLVTVIITFVDELKEHFKNKKE